MRLLVLLAALAACGSNKVPHDLDMEQPHQQQTSKPPPLTPVQTGPEPVAAPTREPTFRYKVSMFVHTAVPAGTDPESAIAIAFKENEDGIMSMQENNASEASAQFRDAIARAPNAVYYLNLCLSLYVEGKYTESVSACEELQRSHPPAGLRRIGDGMHDRILWDAHQQGVTIQPAD
ncbi:MAG TPA: hypothetical protein VGM39_19080 [Kofleriaceae bacterium]